MIMKIIEFITTVVLGVVCLAFSFMNTIRCFVDGHFAVGCIFGIMTFGSVLFICAVHDERTRKRAQQKKERMAKPIRRS